MKLLKLSLAALLSLLICWCCAAPAAPPPSQVITPPAEIPVITIEKPSSLPEEEIDPATTFPVTVTDGLERKITINKPPQYIVSLAPSNTEILFALGLDSRIIGVTDYCNYPKEAALKPHVAGYTTPDLEKLVTLKPDLIMAESVHEKTVLPALENLGFTVILLQSHSLNEILSNISVSGRVTGRIKHAEKLVADISARINAVAAAGKNLPSEKRPRVMYVIWNEPVWTMGRNTYIDDIISKAGGRNIFTADFEKSRVVSPESIVARNPQVIIVSGMGTSADTIANNLKQQPWMQTTDAVKYNQVYVISDSNIIERPGPRIIEGLEEVAKIIRGVK